MQRKIGLDELLDEVSVCAPGMWENEEGPKDWYAVCDEDGIRAYFGEEADAFGFRLYLINLRLNGGRTAARYKNDGTDGR